MFSLHHRRMTLIPPSSLRGYSQELSFLPIQMDTPRWMLPASLAIRYQQREVQWNRRCHRFWSSDEEVGTWGRWKNEREKTEEEKRGKNGRQGTGSDCLGYSTDAPLRCRLGVPEKSKSLPQPAGCCGFEWWHTVAVRLSSLFISWLLWLVGCLWSCVPSALGCLFYLLSKTF